MVVFGWRSVLVVLVCISLTELDFFHYFSYSALGKAKEPISLKWPLDSNQQQDD